MTTTETRPTPQSSRKHTPSDYNGRPIREVKGRVRTPPPPPTKAASEQALEIEGLLEKAETVIRHHAKNDEERVMFFSMLLD